MTIFLLCLIVLLLCPLLQRLLGTVVLVVVGLWAYGHFLAPPAPEVVRPPAVEEVVLPLPPPPVASPPVPDAGIGRDYRPARPYRQQ
jgi:hypothetical protein